MEARIRSDLIQRGCTLNSWINLPLLQRNGGVGAVWCPCYPFIYLYGESGGGQKKGTARKVSCTALGPLWLAVVSSVWQCCGTQTWEQCLAQIFSTAKLLSLLEIWWTTILKFSLWSDCLSHKQHNVIPSTHILFTKTLLSLLLSALITNQQYPSLLSSG